jgi:hypothetical protein
MSGNGVREGHEERRDFRHARIGVALVVLCLAVAGGWTCLWFLGNLKIPRGTDAEEAGNLVVALQARYPFRVMSADGGRPAVYAKPHPDYTMVFVYGDYRAEEREEIVRRVRALRVEKARKPIHVYFYLREQDRRDLVEEVRIP